jgi:hypothetical protein
MRKGEKGNENGELSECSPSFIDAVQINTVFVVCLASVLLTVENRDDLTCQYPSYLQ